MITGMILTFFVCIFKASDHPRDNGSREEQAHSLSTVHTCYWKLPGQPVESTGKVRFSENTPPTHLAHPPLAHMWEHKQHTHTYTLTRRNKHHKSYLKVIIPLQTFEEAGPEGWSSHKGFPGVRKMWATFGAQNLKSMSLGETDRIFVMFFLYFLFLSS